MVQFKGHAIFELFVKPFLLVHMWPRLNLLSKKMSKIL